LDKNDGTLIGYLETPSLAAAKAGMEKKEINAKWQAEMAEFFVALEGKRPDEGFLQLEEVFHLN
jgi:L-rhamnose mutarotase